MKVYEDIIYQHLLREFIEKAKALKKDELLNRRNLSVARVVLKLAAQRYVFDPIPINDFIKIFERQVAKED